MEIRNFFVFGYHKIRASVLDDDSDAVRLGKRSEPFGQIAAERGSHAHQALYVACDFDVDFGFERLYGVGLSSVVCRADFHDCARLFACQRAAEIYFDVLRERDFAFVFIEIGGQIVFFIGKRKFGA